MLSPITRQVDEPLVQNYELLTAIGTVAAVVVALGVALTQATVAIVLSVRRRRLARRKVASLVSTWLEHTYEPSSSGEYYRRTVKLHLANESDEPVFKVEVLCGIETEKGVVQLGPLAAPRVIPVVPPRREFTYDVTMGMMGFSAFAHDSFNGLVASARFRDHEGKRWERVFSGELRRVKRPQSAEPLSEADELAVAQSGPTDDPYNPFSVVFAFCSFAAEDNLHDDAFHMLLSTQAEGWADTPLDVILEVRALLRGGRARLACLVPNASYRLRQND